VAVSVTLAPTVAEVGEAASVIVLVVVPVPVGACQKFPQPARNGTKESVSSISAIPVRMLLFFIKSPRSFSLVTRNAREHNARAAQ
jgi:hypothetical protein